MYKGAVFFDVDGTITDGWANVFVPSEKTKEAIRRLDEAGYLTCMATGRSMCYINESTKLFSCYVASNGSYAEADGSVCASCPIPHALVRELAGYFEAHGINYVIEGRDKCYCGDLEEKYFLHMVKVFDYSGEGFYKYTGALDMDVYKLMTTYDDMAKEKAFRAAYGDLLDITDQPGNNASDVCGKNVNKGWGARKVMEHFGIAKENCYAFGDADNDYDMLLSVGCGVAMGRHTEKLERAAKLITGTVAQEGVYTALLELGLI